MFVDRVADHAAHLGVAHLDLGQRLAVFAFAQQVGDAAIPVHVQAGVERRVGQDRRCPFDGVDLGHHGGVDETRDVEEALVVPLRVGGLEHVAHGVVFARKHGVQHGQPQPPVACEAGGFDALGVQRQRAVVVHTQLAVDAATQARLRGLVAAVDLRAVPPMGDFVDGAGGRHFAPAHARRVGLCFADEHLGLPVAAARGVVFGQRHFDHVVENNLAVVDPVAVHELNP